MIGILGSKNKIEKKKGFTLMEILVTVAVFSLIFGMIAGLFSSALKAHRRSLAYQELLSQSSYVMEYISRRLRSAQTEESVLEDYPLKVGFSCLGPDKDKAFRSDVGNLIFVGAEADPCCWNIGLQSGTKRLGQISSQCNTPIDWTYLTSDEVIVNEFGISFDTTNQPKITIYLEMRGGLSEVRKIEEQPIIRIQNTISQRDFNDYYEWAY